MTTVANRKPLFVGQPKTTATAISATANTARDGTGTITTVFTASSPTSVTGYLLEVLKVVANGTTAAGQLNIFYKPSGGSFTYMASMQVTAATPNTTTTPAFQVYYTESDLPLRMNPGDSIGIATTIAQAFTAYAQGGTLDNLDTNPQPQ